MNPLTNSTEGLPKGLQRTLYMQMVFNVFKPWFTSAHILVHFHANKESIVVIDVSDHALGVVLL